MEHRPSRDRKSAQQHEFGRADG